MRRFLGVFLLLGLAASGPARAEDLPPELIELFEQIGISLDENSVPTPPPPPPRPTPPPEPEPLSPEDLAELLGIPVELLLPDPNATPPAPVPPPASEPPTPIVDPLTPEELAELLGLPVELFTGGDPAPSTPVTPLVPPPVINTPEELFEFLSISPVGVGEQPSVNTPPVTPGPTLTPDDLDFWLMLGFDGFPAQPPASAAVPEPSSALLLALAAGLAPRRRR